MLPSYFENQTLLLLDILTTVGEYDILLFEEVIAGKSGLTLTRVFVMEPERLTGRRARCERIYMTLSPTIPPTQATPSMAPTIALELVVLPAAGAGAGPATT